LARTEEAEQALPKFVRVELEEYLKCGLLEHGFARVHCGGCGFDRLVAFSRAKPWARTPHVNNPSSSEIVHG
jgi:hypothetical protein